MMLSGSSTSSMYDSQVGYDVVGGYVAYDAVKAEREADNEWIVRLLYSRLLDSSRPCRRLRSLFFIFRARSGWLSTCFAAHSFTGVAIFARQFILVRNRRREKAYTCSQT